MKPTTSQVVVLETLFFKPATEQPTSIEVRYTVACATDETPFTRKTRVGSKEAPIDPGWHDVNGIVHIHNIGPEQRTKIPTEEEVAADAACVLEILQDINAPGLRTQHSPPLMRPVLIGTLRPGEAMRFRPPDVKRISLRCAGGTTRTSVTVYPE